ncbi:MAG: hypothetical protein QXH11_05405, partial [Candidatus Caldarchaeum sp.]
GQVYAVLAAIMVVNILVGVAYYVRLVQSIFLKNPSPPLEKLNPVGASMTAPLLVLAAAAILIGVYPTPFLDAAFLISNQITA